MQTSVKIYGAKTLERYTKNLLVKGFENNECTAFETQEGNDRDAENILFQLHGAPQADDDDRTILGEIKRAVTFNETRKIVMLHRPDELKKYKELPGILSGASQKIGLVFLGDKLIRDTFYPSSEQIIKRVIPHGFFPFDEHQKHLQETPIIIGSHTTWGEMRSVEHALKLLLALFKLNKENKIIIGYLGGKPHEELELNSLKEITERINTETSLQFLNVHDHKTLEGVLNRGRNIILVDDRNEEPLYFSVTFNIQMYYLGTAVRMGESSGSAHTSASIPVVLEMNGAESIEELKVIKVPYGEAKDISSIDFREGAKMVFDSIENGTYKDMLVHNLKQSEAWNNTRIGREYLNLYEELGA